MLTRVGEVGKMLGEKWKTLSEKQRTPYEAKAAADKKRYEEAKAAYAVSTAIPLRQQPRLTCVGQCRGRRGGV